MEQVSFFDTGKKFKDMFTQNIICFFQFDTYNCTCLKLILKYIFLFPMYSYLLGFKIWLSKRVFSPLLLKANI